MVMLDDISSFVQLSLRRIRAFISGRRLVKAKARGNWNEFVA
jgi:hypothetical protein